MHHSDYIVAGWTKNCVTVSAAFRPKDFRFSASREVYAESWGLALGRKLHDLEVPWVVINGLSNDNKGILLRRFMKWPTLKPRKRILLCQCMRGLESRLRALGSCMSFAKTTSRELIVV